MANIREYNIKDKVRNLDIEANGVVSSTKYFPVFKELGKEKIFKPLSKTKPYSTPLFAYSESYWSYFLNKYMDPKTPIYHVAICKDLSLEQPKYYDKGSIVPNILQKDEKLINLLELFKKYPDKNVDIDDYINYCEMQYDYEKILKSDFFTVNKSLGEQLAFQILCSILRRDDNYHYENVSFIEKNGKITKIAPMIDMEFSEMFMHPDEIKKHKEKFSMYDEGMGPNFIFDDKLSFEENYGIFKIKLNEGPIYDKFDIGQFYNVRNNLRVITELYPNMCKDFLEKLKMLRREVATTKINFNNDFLGTFSSIDWKPTRMLFKEGKNEDDEEYIQALKEAEKRKVRLDTIEFNKRLIREVLWSIDRLTYFINLYLNINKGKISDVLYYDNKTLYDKVDRPDIKLLERIYEIEKDKNLTKK